MIERYSLPKMKSIWSQENKFQKWLDIELLACEAQAKLKVVPEEAVAEIKSKACFDIKRIEKIEEEVQHDVIAFLTNVAEYVGAASKYIHFGMTSSDVVDTALSVQMKEAVNILIDDCEKLKAILKEKALKYRNTIMIGRSHGVHAEPTTFGLKLALWTFEMSRNIERLRKAKETISYGKISGAVGTYANIDPFVETHVCEKLGLKPAEVSTQVLQRDRHAEYMCALAVVASSLDKFATEIRHLQRTEILEVEEPFISGQKGSSAMPHKKNPIICERISGLARIVRSNAQAALENVVLWHERDISHSSVERVIIPDSTILLDYMLHKFNEVIQNLAVYPENMRANLEKTQGLVFSQRVMLSLVEKGMFREEAYGVVQRCAMRTWTEKKNFKEVLLSDDEVRSCLSQEELDKIFDYLYYLRNVDKIFERL
ncbi:MAG: adenylosuccinate lyase [Candidatus Subteraquimicrobiales bacterium]|nr:adenylosuccinate lyase [Candidatus Subteraquimicrobiales bacterium]